MRFTRIPPDSPDVTHAVILALSDGRPAIGQGELIAVPGQHAAVSKMLVEDTVHRVRSGDIVVAYMRRLWDHDANAWRYPTPPRLIPANEMHMWGDSIEAAA
jgi:hypothetical protein